MKTGDILETDFGATMQLPVFYKVTKVTPKTVSMNRLVSTSVDGDGMIGHCVPTDVEDTDRYCGKMTARIRENGTAWSAKNRLHFHPYNGKPAYYNHMD